MTQTEIVKNSPAYRCGVRVSERLANCDVENCTDIRETIGAFDRLDAVTFARITKEWKRGYSAVKGTIEPRTSHAADIAWGRLIYATYGVKLSTVKPRSTSPEALRKAAQRAANRENAPKTENTDAPTTDNTTLTLTSDEIALILALRAKGLASKDYASLIASL